MSLWDTINHEKKCSYRTPESRRKSLFRATPTKAGRYPGIQGFKRFLDSGFRRNDEVDHPSKSLKKNSFEAENTENDQNAGEQTGPQHPPKADRAPGKVRRKMVYFIKHSLLFHLNNFKRGAQEIFYGNDEGAGFPPEWRFEAH